MVGGDRSPYKERGYRDLVTLERHKTLLAPPREKPYETPHLAGPSADLVLESARAERSLGRVFAILLGMALAVVAMVLPTLRIVEPGPEYVAWLKGNALLDVHLLPFLVARAIHAIPGLGPETAWRVLSALSFGLCVPVLASSLQAIGFSRRLSLAVTVLALFAPAAWLGATIAGPAAPGLLAASLVMGSMLLGLDSGPNRFVVRVVTTWVVACLINLGCVLLFPAVATSVLRHRGAGKKLVGVILVAGLAALGGALALAGSLSGTPPAETFWRDAFAAMIGGRGAAENTPLGWILVLLPSLGVGFFGLVALLLPPERKGDARPPVWLLVWAAVPLFLVPLFSPPGLGLALLVVLPAVPVGMGYWFARRSENLAPLGVLGAGQIVLTVTFCMVVGRMDPEAEWCSDVRAKLEPTDLVLTRNGTHEYLLENRLDIEVVNLDRGRGLSEESRRVFWQDVAQVVREAHSSERRVILDSGPEFSPELHQIALLAPLIDFEDLGRLGAEEELPLDEYIQTLELGAGEEILSVEAQMRAEELERRHRKALMRRIRAMRQ